MNTAIARGASLALALPLIFLAGCGSKPTTITGSGPADTQAADIAAAPPVKLPPAMLASKTYRCKDNSIIYVDYFNDNVTANLHTKKDGTPIPLAAPAAGQPFAGGGYELTGQPDSNAVTFKSPSGSQSCNI